MKNTIKENREFVYAYRKGDKEVSPYFVLYCVKNNSQYNKLGITVSKAIGKAHSRNRAKRIIREAYRDSFSQAKKGYNVVIVARERILDAPFEKVCLQMTNALKKLELFDKTTDTGDRDA